MRGRWAQYRKVLYSAGFDKIHYSGLTIIRRLFFVRQFLLDKFLKALSSDRKNILPIQVRQEFWIRRQTNVPVGRQKIKVSVFIRTRKPFSFFMWDTFFWQKLFHNLRNYFWRRERWRQFFHLFLFRFHQTIGLFFLWTQIPNSKKNDKSFFGQKKIWELFSVDNGICKIEIRLICAFTV